jgi:acetyl esterase/lipase
LGTHYEEENIFLSDDVDTISCRPDFMVLVYPVITFQEPYLHMGSRHFLIGDSPNSALINYYSNELHVNKNTPPTFIIHAGDDKSVPVENSLMFYQKLKDNSVFSEMHIYPTGGHGFSLALGKAHLSTWTDRCIDWLTEFDKR